MERIQEMPRTQRLKVSDETTVYHVMSRTALDGFPLGNVEKDFMLDLIKRYSALYFVEILGFCLMGNHFHILVKMFPDHKFTNQDIKERFIDFHGEERVFADGFIPSLRAKLSNLSEFVREIKVGFARYYNRRHHRCGYFWGDRFKSVIVEKGETLINCLAYIDLNPLRAGIVSRPEEYRWNSLGYHVQTENKDDFLSLDFGLKEFDPDEIRSAVTSEFHGAGVLDAQERLNRYRRYVYKAGALNRPDKNQAKVIDHDMLKNECQKNYQVSRVDRFLYRTRYFTDSGIIGTKEFVSLNYQRFKDIFMSKREKIPKAVTGLNGVYSLKRLTE
jgi:REP element-mobilizing transposase RayT